VAILLDGNKLSDEIRAEIKCEIDSRKINGHWHTTHSHWEVKPAPCLAVVLCSQDPASEVYVRRKQEACKAVGINSFVTRPFESGLENWYNPMGHLLELIEWMNNEDAIQGILVQLPLPEPLCKYKVFDAICPMKDVDVFSPENVGLLLQGRPRFVPCTPAGIQELLSRNKIPIKGKKVCIINRSDIVGKPLKALLVQDNEYANATVTMCHDNTPPDRLKEVCLASDIIVVAVGKQNFLTEDMVPEGAVVVDVGINRVEGTKKIVGDVDYERVLPKVSAITPVPGGVGPMTVTMLLRNTVKAQEVQVESRRDKSYNRK
jgi:methylenetetrahydrofolate dehydrogenase (NADP+)/methenyltetrahydrofolate cyclohydrolase